MRLNVAAFIGGELHYGQVSAYSHIGTYLYRGTRAEDGGNIWNKFGIKVNLNQFLFFSIAIRSHLGRADFVEYGLGYNF